MFTQALPHDCLIVTNDVDEKLPATSHFDASDPSFPMHMAPHFPQSKQVDVIVTSPPYKQFIPILENALAMAPVVAFKIGRNLLDPGRNNNYLFLQQRGLRFVILMSRKILGGDKGSGACDRRFTDVWLVWTRTERSEITHDHTPPLVFVASEIVEAPFPRVQVNITYQFKSDLIHKSKLTVSLCSPESCSALMQAVRPLLVKGQTVSTFMTDPAIDGVFQGEGLSISHIMSAQLRPISATDWLCISCPRDEVRNLLNFMPFITTKGAFIRLQTYALQPSDVCTPLLRSSALSDIIVFASALVKGAPSLSSHLHYSVHNTMDTDCWFVFQKDNKSPC